MAGGFGDEGPSRSTRMIVARPRARGRGLAIRMSYWRSSGQQMWVGQGDSFSRSFGMYGQNVIRRERCIFSYQEALSLRLGLKANDDEGEPQSMVCIQ